MNRVLSLIAITFVSLQLAGCDAYAESPATTVATDAAKESPEMSFTHLKLTSLTGEAFDTAQLEGKAVLFVNVASKCGYTRQYDGLQKLYEARRGDGLVIVGVPCNQFGGQEPGSAAEIQTFCKMNYGVTFPLLQKQDVNGSDRSALYDFLVGSEAGGGRDIGWNFEKFVVGTDGQVVGRFSSRVEPGSETLGNAIDEALGR